MRDHARHAAHVDAWLAREARDLPPAQFMRLVALGLDTIWQRTAVTLGEVTLVAIAERVLNDVTARFPCFGALMVEPTGIQCRELIEHIADTRESEVREGARFMLVELLTVLGSLTAEILTPDLHAQLAEVTLPDAPARRLPHRPLRRIDTKDKPS